MTLDLETLGQIQPVLKTTKRYDDGFIYEPPEHYLYFDYETPITESHGLRKESLRDYLSYVTDNITECTVAFAVDDDEPTFARYGDGEFNRFHELFNDPRYLPVAHNSSFDIRVAVLVFKCDYPYRSHCSLELSKKCWPSQAGGHGLKNLSKTFDCVENKLDIDLTNCTDEELEEYNKVDVLACRSLHKLALSLMSAGEIAMAEQAARVRKLVFDIDRELADRAKTDFLAVATDAVAGLAPELFGWTDQGEVKSVRYQYLKQWMSEELGFETDTTSKKKINPELLAGNEAAAHVVEVMSQIGKALYYARKSGSLTADTLDLNYMYYAAHTGRPSGKGDGRGGLNALNLPKHNKRIANIIRPMFILQDKYMVSADFANIEYRTLGLITKCKHIYKVFEEDVLADPYAHFCHAATGFLPDKRNPDDVPIRQIFKKGVLSLTYLAGLVNWIHQMLIAIGEGEITLQEIADVAAKQNWRKPNNKYVRECQRKTHAPDAVVSVCYHTWHLFHEVHPEFKRFGEWLMTCAETTCGSLDPEHDLSVLTKYAGAPDPEWLELNIDWNKRNERSITARCGKWDNTVCWRDLAIRMAKQYGEMKPCLTALHETKAYRPLTKNIVIENVNQSFARNAMCALKMKMDKDFPEMFDIYDDLKVVVEAERIREARDTMLRHAGPGTDGCGYGWAVVIDPTEIEVSKTFKATCPSEEWWDDIDLSIIT